MEEALRAGIVNFRTLLQAYYEGHPIKNEIFFIV